MIETWKPIPGFGGLYEASDAGKIRSRTRVDNLGRTFMGRVLSGSKQTVNLSVEGRVIGKSRGELVLITFVAKKPPRHFVRHLNGDRLDCRVENLMWMRHMPQKSIKDKESDHYQERLILRMAGL